MFNIQFDFNPETSEIINLKVVKIDTSTNDALVSVEDNKLKFNKKALELMNIKADDRVVINYYTVSPEETFPVIGNANIFKIEGNRVTKSNTVSYRGSQREILLEYGKFFKLEPFKEYFKMVAITESSDNDDLSEEEQDLQNLEKEI